MLQPTVATIQSPLFSERICAEINIHVSRHATLHSLGSWLCAVCAREARLILNAFGTETALQVQVANGHFLAALLRQW